MLRQVPAAVTCPYCWERIEILVDPSADAQDYIEDCSVCCNPIRFLVHVDEAGEVRVEALGQDE